jgi:hypothetical protein
MLLYDSYMQFLFKVDPDPSNKEMRDKQREEKR